MINKLKITRLFEVKLTNPLCSFNTSLKFWVQISSNWREIIFNEAPIKRDISYRWLETKRSIKQFTRITRFHRLLKEQKEIVYYLISSLLLQNSTYILNWCVHTWDVPITQIGKSYSRILWLIQTKAISESGPHFFKTFTMSMWDFIVFTSQKCFQSLNNRIIVVVHLKLKSRFS